MQLNLHDKKVKERTISKTSIEKNLKLLARFRAMVDFTGMIDLSNLDNSTTTAIGTNSVALQKIIENTPVLGETIDYKPTKKEII